MEINLISDVIIPIICSLIGSVTSILGIRWTIKNENKKDLEKRKVEVKPIFYRIDPMQEYDYKLASDMHFEASRTKGNIRNKIWGIFKNTDQAIMKLKYIEIDSVKYYPIYGDVVDKNAIFDIYVWLDNAPTEEKVTLYIEDILGNTYKYKIILEKNGLDFEVKKIQEI